MMCEFTRMIAEFPVAEVSRAIAYYRDTLGFVVNYADDAIGVMDRGSARILLIPKVEPFTGPASCYVYVSDANAIHAVYAARQVNLLGSPVDHPWGLRDFAMLDPDGNRITLGQPLW